MFIYKHIKMCININVKNKPLKYLTLKLLKYNLNEKKIFKNDTWCRPAIKELFLPYLMHTFFGINHANIWIISHVLHTF